MKLSLPMTPSSRRAAGSGVRVLVAALAFTMTCASMAHESRGLAAPSTSAYDDRVLADRPVMYLPLGGANGTKDLSGRDHDGTPYHGPTTTTFANGDPALKFDGVRQYVEVADRDDLSVSSSGVLTMEAWLRPTC
jgi:hypothetical protein